MPVDFIADHGSWTLSVVVTDPPWYENCYIVGHPASGKLAVVDPGGNADKIQGVVEETGGTVECILLTHGHPDHLGAVRALQEVWDVPCRAHRNEAELIGVIPQYAKARLGMTVEPPRSVDYFGDDDVLTLGGQIFRAIPTPGHTPGGVCFDFGPFTLTGDTLFNQGVGRTDLPGGNGALLMKSITGLLPQLADSSFLYSGHGPRWTAGEAKPWWKAMSAYGGM